ncbi:HAMP domain-containing protein [Nocardioides sp.]|uniref:HAMP domain-containing protein n=1 Tax=Nocardioides sp. TaxID=35761 RepID=UPI00262F1173|nr:HAMP domain-containing protein [Nocardioides sp.]
MRRRLTLSFVLLALLLWGVVFALRSISLTSSVTDREREEVHQAATSIAAAVRVQAAAGGEVTPSFLDSFRADDQMVRLRWRSGATVVSKGKAFEGSPDPSLSNDIWSAMELSNGYVIVSQARTVVGEIVFKDPWLVVLSFLGLGAAAALSGSLVARALASPFRKLAQAAGALGRGRFDLDLPRSRMPEVQAIAAALKTSASQLQDRISQEQSFAEHASHVLRTPLTSLRLELDDLAMTESIPDHVRDALDRCVQRINALDVVTGELVELARQTSRVPGAEITVAELVTGCSQRWADELAHHDRELGLSTEGDLDVLCTPGPLEHLHELLLVDVLHRSRGDVRLGVVADGRALRISITSDHPARIRGTVRGPGSTFLQARAVVTALGGRMEGDQFDTGVNLLIPRR